MWIDSFVKHDYIAFLRRRFIYTGFLTSGVIHFVNTSGFTDSTFEYFYDNRLNNKNLITLKTLSTNANVTMKGPDGNFYKEFQSFVNYYGDTNYGDKWIAAAIKKTETAFSSLYVHATFTCF